MNLVHTFVGILNSHGEPTWDEDIKPAGAWVCGCGHILPIVSFDTPLTWTWPEHVAKALVHETPCECILIEDPQWHGHTRGDHTDEKCTGSWTYDPPCGGCINCIAAQMYYYKSLREAKHVEASVVPEVPDCRSISPAPDRVMCTRVRGHKGEGHVYNVAGKKMLRWIGGIKTEAKWRVETDGYMSQGEWDSLPRSLR